MTDQKTTSDLRQAAKITDDEINAAVDAVLAIPDTGSYPIGGGYLLDLAAAMEAHEPTRVALADADSRQGWRRTMARTAILMARPEEA
jgi:hypothetical protein